MLSSLLYVKTDTNTDSLALDPVKNKLLGKKRHQIHEPRWRRAARPPQHRNSQCLPPSHGRRRCCTLVYSCRGKQYCYRQHPSNWVKEEKSGQAWTSNILRKKGKPALHYSCRGGKISVAGSIFQLELRKKNLGRVPTSENILGKEEKKGEKQMLILHYPIRENYVSVIASFKIK